MLGGEARGREICSLDVSFLNNKQERIYIVVLKFSK